MDKSKENLDKYILKTGTLTVGIVCKDGIILAADNRVTYGNEGGVAYISRTHEKVHKINDRIIATTAGTASDSRRTLKIISAQIKLKELKDKKETSMKEAASLMSTILFQNIRTPSMIPSITHFLIAGYDNKGKASLYDASPDGFLQQIETYQATGAPFETLGILDVEYDKSITLEQGIKLAIKVFEATKGRQPSVGDGFDIYTITSNKIEKVFSKKVKTELVEKEV